MSNPYEQYYATLDSDALLAILQKPEEYQPEALAAAQRELDKRNHTPEELEEMEQYLTHKKQEQEKSSLSYRASGVAAEAPAFYRTLQTQAASANLRTLSILVTILAGISLWSHFYLLEWLFAEGIGLDLEFFISCIEALWLPAAAVLLWRRHRAGWIMTVVFLSYFAAGKLGMYMHEVLNPPPVPDFGAEAFNSMFPQKGFFHYFILILFSGSILVYACVPVIRRELDIQRSTFLLSLLVPAVLTFLLLSRALF
jgi:hypothetical protein